MVNNLGPIGQSTTSEVPSKPCPEVLPPHFTMKRYESGRPIRHPRYIIENTDYKETVIASWAGGIPYKISRSFEERLFNLRDGNFRTIGTALKNRISKWMKRISTIKRLLLPHTPHHRK